MWKLSMSLNLCPVRVSGTFGHEREVDYTQAKWSGRQSEEIVKVSHLDSRSGRTFASNS
jgi:hypothetical protein